MSKGTFSYGVAPMLVLTMSCAMNSSVAQVINVQRSSLTLAQELMDQADALYKAGEYSAAIPLAKRVVSLREKTVGIENPDTALALTFLGRLYCANGSYALAEKPLQRAVAINEKAQGLGHPDTAYALNYLANLYWHMAAYAKAEPLYRRALSIREKSMGPNHSDTATSLYNLALLYSEIDDNTRAEPLLQRALDIREKTLGPDHPFTARSLNSLATLYLRTGAYAKAEVLFQRVVTLNERVLGPAHPDTAFALTNLAVLYERIGADMQAESIIQRAISINEKVLDPEHPDTAHALNMLGDLYLKLERYTQAEPILLRALAITERAYGMGHPAVAFALEGLAELYEKNGEYTKAEKLYFREIAIREATLGAWHTKTGTAIARLGALKWKLGEPSTALKLLQRAQNIQAKNSQQFLLAASEARKQTYLQTLATDNYMSVSFSATIRSTESATLGLNSVLTYKGRVLDSTSDSLLQLRQSIRSEDRKLLDQLSQVASQLSTLTYQGSDNESTARYRKQVDELTQRKENLESSISKHSSDFRRHLTPVTVATVQQAIPLDAVLLELYRYKPFSREAAGRKTKEAKPRYIAYILKRQGAPLAVDLGDADVIESATQEFRAALSDPKRDDIKLRALVAYKALLNPIYANLQGAKHLLISPDGALNLIPMSALVNEKGEYLAQNFEITYLTSGRDLLRMTSKPHEQSNAVVVANPDFGTPFQFTTQTTTELISHRSIDLDRSGLLFRPLPNTAREAQSLKELLNLSPENLWVHGDATEARVKQVRGPRILHIASHGFFLSNQEFSAEVRKRNAQDSLVSSGENPLLRSGIALAGANLRQSGLTDDGVLTALEVAQLDLRGTELVVLSACDSGIGDVQNGEGVYGLRRALVLAGTQTQVTSLWKVSDEATRMLMVEFYQRLINGEGRSAALRHSQQTMMVNAELSHPYYWASFVPIGNWAPMPTLH